MPKQMIEYVSIDENNAILINDYNTQYIRKRIKEATEKPSERARIYAEMARLFAVDADKINSLIIRYTSRIKMLERKGLIEFKEKDELSPKELKALQARLCKEIGHRFVGIRLSHLRAYNECQRCGKVVRKYKLRCD